MKPCPVRIVAACPGGALRAVGHTVEVPRRGSVHPMKPRQWPVVFPLRRKRTGAGAETLPANTYPCRRWHPPGGRRRPHGMMASQAAGSDANQSDANQAAAGAATPSPRRRARAAGLRCVRCCVLAAIVCLPRKRWKTSMTRGPPGHSRSGRAAVRDTTESTRPLSYCGLSARLRTRKRSKREYARARLRGNRAASPSP